jgi:hypothetical protein
MTHEVVVGESLEHRPGELAALVALVTNGQLRAARTDQQPDGDVRFWNVDVQTSPILQRLKTFGEKHFEKVVGRPPAASLIMVNHIDALKSPAGSGGGWHRDSFSRQYKAFVYLTDVPRESFGAFAFIPNSNAVLPRAVSLVHRMLTRGNRYSDATITAGARFGLAPTPMLLGAASPFFVDTSLIHRGLPITEGTRIMATLYMYETRPTWLQDYT